MPIFEVDKEKCTKCKLCVKECPIGLIEIDNSFPFISEEKLDACISCQHCFAICPTGAISIDNYKSEDSIKIKNNFPEYEKLEILVKGRRSIRKYKQENIEKEILYKLLNDALHAPTGVNAMKVNFRVIDDIKVLNKYKMEIYNGIKCLADKKALPEGMEFFEGIAEKWFNSEIDVIFRNAPHMIIATAPKSCPTPSVDTVIALSYLDLLAPAMGLGTLWCGMAKWAIHDILPEMGQLLGVPQDHVIGYVMLLGKPDIKFTRTVQRTAKISIVK